MCTAICMLTVICFFCSNYLNKFDSVSWKEHLGERKSHFLIYYLSIAGYFMTIWIFLCYLWHHHKRSFYCEKFYKRGIFAIFFLIFCVWMSWLQICLSNISLQCLQWSENEIRTPGAGAADICESPSGY